MSGNTYHLYQHMWNDVNEEWPYYTEQEKQILKRSVFFFIIVAVGEYVLFVFFFHRRKPQNLTPPGSSDTGSSGSGQSPTSTHPGSPPPPVTSSVKRPGYIEGADGLPTKRPRISHYRKPEPVSAYTRPADNGQRRPPTDSRDASNMNPRSREPLMGYMGALNSDNGYGSSLVNKRHYSDEENDVGNSRKRACDSHSLSYAVNREKTVKENSICSSPNKLIVQDEFRGKESPIDQTSVHNSRSRLDERERNREREREREKERTRWNKVSSTTHNGNGVPQTAPDSPDSQADRIPTDTGPPPPVTPLESNSEFPDYLT